MWICCSSQKHPDIETKFCTDNNFFHVISVLPFNYSPCDAVLYACFKSGTAKREIMVGKYISSDSGYIADKKGRATAREIVEDYIFPEITPKNKRNIFSKLLNKIKAR